MLIKDRAGLYLITAEISQLESVFFFSQILFLSFFLLISDDNFELLPSEQIQSSMLVVPMETTQSLYASEMTTENNLPMKTASFLPVNTRQTVALCQAWELSENTADKEPIRLLGEANSKDTDHS